MTSNDTFSIYQGNVKFPLPTGPFRRQPNSFIFLLLQYQTIHLEIHYLHIWIWFSFFFKKKIAESLGRNIAFFRFKEFWHVRTVFEKGRHMNFICTGVQIWSKTCLSKWLILVDKRGYETYSLLQLRSPIALCLTLVKIEFQWLLISLQYWLFPQHWFKIISAWDAEALVLRNLVETKSKLYGYVYILFLFPFPHCYLHGILLWFHSIFENWKTQTK